MLNNPIINYTSRDFDSIRNDLLNYVKKYYPNDFKDFNEASFGSIILDLVAYTGDILSYYTDFNFNETNLETAIKFENVVNLARKLGYKYSPTYASHGLLTFYILVPVSNNGISPNRNYMPILRRGSKFGTSSGKIFTLTEDVNFANTENEIVVGQVDSNTGAPLTYAVKAYGRCISGQLAVFQVATGNYQRFRRIKIPGTNITEIVSVFDANGNKWYEVDSLTQNTIYIPIINRNSDKYTVPNLIKPVKINKKFIVERDFSNVYLRFGSGATDTNDSLLDPSKIALNIFGRNYISDQTIDPSNLVQSDTMGVDPTSTTLFIVYRINNQNDVNTGTNTVTSVIDATFDYPDKQNLSNTTINTVNGTLEVNNDFPISGDTTEQTIEEIKLRAYGSFSSQDRAVTKEDYIALVYKMPPQFGSIKRVNLVQDRDSINQRNLNMYVISDTTVSGINYLTTTTDSIKQNIKEWISSKKMINDTVDIFDAKIINFGVKFTVTAFPETGNKYSTYRSSVEAIKKLYTNKFEIGEPILISDIYKVLKDVPEVLDVNDVSILLRSGINYSNTNFNIDNQTSNDGRVIYCPYDSIFELKYFDKDILGEVI